MLSEHLPRVYKYEKAFVLRFPRLFLLEETSEYSEPEHVEQGWKPESSGRLKLTTLVLVMSNLLKTQGKQS